MKNNKEEKRIKQFEYRQCTHPECEVKMYPATEEFFYMHKRTNKKKGTFYVLSNWCRKCHTKNTQKNIATKDQDKRIAYFKTYNKHRRDKDKEKKRLRKRYLRDKDILAERLRVWQQSEKGKAKMKVNNEKRRQKNHQLTDSEWGNCREYFANACAYCGMSWEEHFTTYIQDLHKEHVVDDGRNDIKNCVPACKACNSEKHESTLNQWYDVSNHKYSRVRYLRIYQWLRYDAKRFAEKKKKK